MTDPQSKSAHIFISEDLTICEGEEAAALLEAQSIREAQVFDPRRGILRVDRARWQEAQRYERRTWLEQGRRARTDRNEHHRERFANYAPLRGRAFERGIELGCGPFTNMRLILEHCDIKEVVLLDPLIQDYLAHPFCQYQSGHMSGVLNCVPALRELRHPIRFLRNTRNAYHVGGLRGRPVILEASMIETYETDLRFDLVVMINVLQHCQDAEAVLHKVLEIILPRGIFVFGDAVYDAEEIQRLAPVLYDAGHPLKIVDAVADDFLAHNFEPLMQANYLVEHDFRGVHLRHYDRYFVGQRLGPDRSAWAFNPVMP
jgi:SAM-dependent methyltransferase